MGSQRVYQASMKRLGGTILAVFVVAAGCSGPTAGPSPRSSAPTSPGPSLSTGGVVEYAIPDPAKVPADCGLQCQSSPGTLIAGPDGNVWFVDVGRGQVGRVTPSGSFAQFVLPNPAGGAHTLVKGSDGNVWVIARGTGANSHDWLVRVSPDGAMTRFAAGASGTGLDSIAAGPDGNLWFTDVFGARIGRMTPSGSLTEFHLQVPSAPRGITTGPDGNLWFTDESRVWRMTTKGEAVYYPVGNDPSLPLGDIVAGPDGKLWFASHDGLRRISPANGGIEELQLPPGAKPFNLVAGPDGNIWFTDTGLNAVARLSASGSIREFNLPRRDASPLGIAVGADGRIWFAEAGYGRIASIGVKVPEIRLDGRSLHFSGTSRQAVPVRNVGEATLTITDVRLTGVDASLFTKTKDTCSGKALAPNATCDLDVTYAGGGPTGVQSAYLEVADNATGSPQRIGLVANVPDCQLPVLVAASTDADSVGQPRFLNVRSGETVAPAGDGFESNGEGKGIRTIASPVLTGNGPGFFERKSGRFLPVASEALISPDGSRYVYVLVEDPGHGQIHVVDVSSGRDRVVPVPPGFWVPVAFTSKGIYLHQAYEGVGPGVSLVDPDSGTFSSAVADGAVYAVSGSTAWIAIRNAADKLPEPPGMGGSNNTIVKRNLDTGTVTTWFYRPGTNMWVVAIANDAPVVNVSDGQSSTFYVVDVANRGARMDFVFTTDRTPLLDGFVGGRSGIWVGSPDGIYLWTKRTGGVLVSDVVAVPASRC